MADCCSSIEDLGCINFCDTIYTGYTAEATGTYVISIVGGGGYIEVAGTLGAELYFDNVFNEDAITIFQILYNGTVKTVNSNDCFQVKVNAGIDFT